MPLHNNDILRRLRYAFDWKDEDMIRLLSLAGQNRERSEIVAWFKKDEDPQSKIFVDVDLAALLNGWIIERRGKREGPLPIAEAELSNNMILRKIKIALNYKDEDMLQIFALAQKKISKHELSAFFRKPSQQQYRDCQDQYLRSFLKGLQLKYRK